MLLFTGFQCLLLVAAYVVSMSARTWVPPPQTCMCGPSVSLLMLIANAFLLELLAI